MTWQHDLSGRKTWEKFINYFLFHKFITLYGCKIDSFNFSFTIYKINNSWYINLLRRQKNFNNGLQKWDLRVSYFIGLLFFILCKQLVLEVVFDW